MKKLILLSIMICFILSINVVSSPDRVKLTRKQRKQVLKNLPAHYTKWLNMVYHISTKRERNVFLSLTNSKDRNIFIRSFWLQRDPTAGTVENEYKNEIEERFAHVNKYFSRGTSREGWNTAMGMYYMILGKPNSVEMYDSKPGLYPCQVWYYFGDKTLGLPTYFSVMFFKPNNMTEWKFYNPSVDGPASLLVQTEAIDTSNYQGLYEKIKELAPQLAMPAMTMIPNEMAPGFRPPMRNNLIVSNIHDSPKRKVNTSYATHFLNYKGYVHVESSVNFIAHDKAVSVTKYGRFGFNFVNFSFKPQKISVGFNEDKNQYYFSYDINISLKKGDKFIHEEKKHYDFYVDAANVNSLKGNGLVIHYSFPAIPGKYKLTVFAMNSVGKEFTYFDKDLDIPDPVNGPVLATPVVGYKSEVQTENFFFPYRFANKKLFVDASSNMKLRSKPQVLVGAYNLDNETWEKGKAIISVKGLNERKKYLKSYEVALKTATYDKDINILKTIGGENGLGPDYYEVTVKLINGAGKEVDSKMVNFSVSPVKNFAYSMETFKKMRIENPFFFFFTLAGQYDRSGQLLKAEQYYGKSLGNNPQFMPGTVRYLSLLNKLRKYTKVMVEVEKLKGAEQFALDYHLIKATALFGMKDFKEAMAQLVKANAVYDSDTRVLNLMGFTFLNLKDYIEAKRVFNASLGLNNNQALIKKTLKEIDQSVKAKK